MVETFWIPLLIPNDLPVCNLSNCERQANSPAPLIGYAAANSRSCHSFNVAVAEASNGTGEGAVWLPFTQLLGQPPDTSH